MSKDLNSGMDNEQNNISRINSAGLINSTIENLWSKSYEAMSKGSYTLWNTKLDSIWAILGGDLKEGSEEDKKFNELSLKIYEAGSLNSKTGSGFGSKLNGNNALQYQLLLKKSLFLRRLQNKQGKGTAYQTDDDYDME